VADIPLFGGVQVGASLEAARLRPLVPIWRGEIVSGDLTVMAGSVFVGVDSPLGPLFLGFGYANRDNKAVYLFLGLP
jgi:NTE family protein